MKKLLLIALIFATLCSLCVLVSADDNYVFRATDMFGFTSSGGGITGGDIVTEDGTFAIGFSAYGSVSNGNDGTQIQINIKDVANSDFLLKEYPIIKMGYRSTIAADARLDINLGMNYKGVATRLWGAAPSFDHSGKYTTITLDTTKIFTGGEGISGYSWDNVDADSGVNYIRMKSYFEYMADTTGTLWENETSHASCNHGFASHVIYWLDKLGMIK